jgi:hypothetical protein
VRLVLLVLCGVFGMAFWGRAQITLTAASYPASLLGKDSLRVSIFSSAFPSLVPATDAVWDMSIVSDSIPAFFACRVPDAIYQYADSNQYSLGAYGYQGNSPASITSSSWDEYGVAIKEKKHELFSLTSSPTDTLYILAQNAIYTSPLTKLAFPATFNVAWQSAFVNTVQFELTVGAYALLHAPGYVRTYTDRRDTITGWGKMRVKDAAGVPSDYFDVLQVQSTTMTVDSFFLNGVPAPLAMLSLLSLTQGKRDTTFIQNYYRAQEVTPFAKVEYKNAAYASPYKATTHIQRLIASSVGIKATGSTDGITIYPNPVCDVLTIDLPNDGNWGYLILDNAGRKTDEGIIRGQVQQHIRLSPDHAAGHYMVVLMQDGKIRSLKQIELIR